MKKLMIALAVAASAVALNAASIKWAFSEQALDSKTPLDLTSMTAYLFTAADWTAATTVTAATFNNAKDTATLNKSTGGTGKSAWTKWMTESPEVWTDDTAEGGNYYIVLFDGSKYAASTALAATAAKTPQDASTIANWSITAAKTPLSSSDFTNVPEPTSGLLLLLGMAGLALRRKQK